MKILLDECVPKRLGSHLRGHTVRTAPEAGWAGKKNGELLQLAQQEFDVFLTVDQELPQQQSLRGLRLAIVVLRAKKNSLESLLPLVPHILKALEPK